MLILSSTVKFGGDIMSEADVFWLIMGAVILAALVVQIVIDSRRK